MNIRNEMLESAGVYKRKNKVPQLIEEGLYFNNNLERDLRNAVSIGAITNSDVKGLKNKAHNTIEAVNYLFEDLIPRAKEAIENEIEMLEEKITVSTNYEESVAIEESLEVLRDKYNKIKDL